jgi:hypothetical protein
MEYEGNPEEDIKQVKQREKEELAALKRKYASTTDPAKRAELANRLATMGHDPNKDSRLGNPVPERQSPPKATADAAPRGHADMRRELKLTEPAPIGVESDKMPGDQEMYNHETGEWSTDIKPGYQHVHNFSEDTKPERGEDTKPVKDEAKESSKDARQEKAEAAEGKTDDDDAKVKADPKPAAKPAPKVSDPKKREARPGDSKPADSKPSGNDKEVKHVIVNKDKDK